MHIVNWDMIYPDQKESFEKIITQEIELHPQLEFVDLYKLIHQVTFGPGHLHHFINILRRDYNEAQPQPGKLIQRIGWDFPLYRLHHSPYKYGGGKLAPLLRLLQKSVDSPIFPTYDFLEVMSRLLNFLGNRREYHHLAQQGEIFMKDRDSFPPMHHSQIYRELYSPSYIVLLIKSSDLPKLGAAT